MNCLELSVVAGGYERKIKRFCRENLPSYIHFPTARKPETAQPGDEETGRLETKRNETKRSETKMRREWLNVSGCAPERRARVDGGGGGGGGSKHLEGFLQLHPRVSYVVESRVEKKRADLVRHLPLPAAHLTCNRASSREDGIAAGFVCARARVEGNRAGTRQTFVTFHPLFPPLSPPAFCDGGASSRGGGQGCTRPTSIFWSLRSPVRVGGGKLRIRHIIQFRLSPLRRYLI